MSNSYNSILYNVNGPVATITLNRPERYNAIDWAMPSEIRRAVEDANDDPSVKVTLDGQRDREITFLRGVSGQRCRLKNQTKFFYSYTKPDF